MSLPNANTKHQLVYIYRKKDFECVPRNVSERDVPLHTQSVMKMRFSALQIRFLLSSVRHDVLLQRRGETMFA